MTSEERRALVGAAINLAVFGVAVWYSLPGRPPVEPYLWRLAARATDRAATTLGTWSLACRTRYWRAVRP